MKRALASVVYFLITWNSKGQALSTIPPDTLFSALSTTTETTNYKLKKLPRYEVNPCLFVVLDEIVDSDKACSKKIGYYFSCDKIGKKTLLKISPVDISRLVFADFFGYFIYDKRIFLCYGDTRCYLSTSPINRPLTLRPYISHFQPSDLYLGGDTDGVFKVFSCNKKQQYALIKTCVNSAISKARKRQKVR